MNPAGVDVVIPCWNYGRYLKHCVKSVLSQRDVTVRVLIIDDASSDDTSAVGHELAAADWRVDYRRHDLNRGHIATYNEGLLEWASAKYSLLLSADDFLAPGALSRAVSVLERHAEAGMLYGRAQFLMDGPVCSQQFADAGPPTEYRIVSSADFLQHCFEYGNAVPTPTAVVRTALQHRLGGYRPDLPHSGDMEMWMRFAVHAPVAVIRTVQGYVRRHQDNMSLRYCAQALRDNREVFAACDVILSKWGPELSESGAWRRLMATRLAKDACWCAGRAFESGDFSISRECLAYAAAIHPRCRYGPTWWRYRAAHVLGPSLFNVARTAWRRVRSPFGPSSEHPRTPSLHGWWPGELAK